MTSCICEKHKDELKSVSLVDLNKKITEELHKMYALNLSVKTQKKILDILIAEADSRNEKFNKCTKGK